MVNLNLLNKRLNTIVLIVFLGGFQVAIGQKNRLHTNNGIEWHNYFGSFNVAFG